MCWIPTVYLKSGEEHYTWHDAPITEKLENGYYGIVFSRFPLMDYIESKYLDGIMLDILCNFRAGVRSAHQEEIKEILDSCGGTEGEVW